MNSQPNQTTPFVMDQNDSIEDYLDHLCTPLVGLVPWAVRNKLRMEAEEHLCALIAEFSEKGLTPKSALDAAMREHGEPWHLGRAYADEWLRGNTQSRLSRLAAPYVLHGLAWFGMVSVPTLLLVEQNSLIHNSVSPELVTAITVVAPFIAGALTGFTAPMRPVRAVCCALLLHILVSLAAGSLLLPQTEGLYFALFQLIFWLPAGSLSAWLVGYFRLSLRHQRFLSRVCSKAA